MHMSLDPDSIAYNCERVHSCSALEMFGSREHLVFQRLASDGC